MVDIRLANVVTSPVKKVPGRPLPYVALEHIQSGVGRFMVEDELPERDPSDSARFLAGDVLFGKLGPHLQKVIHADFNGCCSTELLVLRPRPPLNDRFVYYLALSAPFVAWAEANAYGTRMPRTSWELMRQFRCSVPALDQQREVVDLLDRESDRIDRLVGKKKRLMDLLHEKSNSLISQAVTGGLSHDAVPNGPSEAWMEPLPSHWRSLPLSRVAHQMTNGYVGPTRDILVDEGVPYVQSLHIKNGKIRHGDDFFVSAEWHRQQDRTRLREGDVLLVQTGDIGQSAVVGQDMAGANCHALIITRVRLDVVDPWFVGYVLRSEGGRGAVLATRTGATHPHLNVGQVRDVRIPVPPLEEQRAIVRYLDATVTTINRSTKALERQIGKLAEYRRALITAAVTGQLDVAASASEHAQVVG